MLSPPPSTLTGLQLADLKEDTGGDPLPSPETLPSAETRNATDAARTDEDGDDEDAAGAADGTDFASFHIRGSIYANKTSSSLLGSSSFTGLRSGRRAPLVGAGRIRVGFPWGARGEGGGGGSRVSRQVQARWWVHNTMLVGWPAWPWVAHGVWCMQQKCCCSFGQCMRLPRQHAACMGPVQASGCGACQVPVMSVCRGCTQQLHTASARGHPSSLHMPYRLHLLSSAPLDLTVGLLNYPMVLWCRGWSLRMCVLRQLLTHPLASSSCLMLSLSPPPDRWPWMFCAAWEPHHP
jgi:hypothetical protein